MKFKAILVKPGLLLELVKTLEKLANEKKFMFELNSVECRLIVPKKNSSVMENVVVFIKFLSKKVFSQFRIGVSERETSSSCIRFILTTTNIMKSLKSVGEGDCTVRLTKRNRIVYLSFKITHGHTGFDGHNISVEQLCPIKIFKDSQQDLIEPPDPMNYIVKKIINLPNPMHLKKVLEKFKKICECINIEIGNKRLIISMNSEDVRMKTTFPNLKHPKTVKIAKRIKKSEEMEIDTNKSILDDDEDELGEFEMDNQQPCFEENLKIGCKIKIENFLNCMNYFEISDIKRSCFSLCNSFAILTAYAEQDIEIIYYIPLLNTDDDDD